jgi:hypothetical protein
MRLVRPAGHLAAAALLGFLLAVAGCAEPAGDGGAEASGASLTATGTGALDAAGNVTGNVTGPPVPLSLVFRDCQLRAVNAPVATDDAEAHLPSGFSPLPFFGAPGQATMVMVTSRCSAVATGFDNLSDVAEGLLYLGVDPPAQYQDDSVGGYRVVLAHGSTSDALAAVFAAWNLTLASAQVALDTNAAGPAAHTTQDTVGGVFTLATRTEATSLGPGPENRLRFFYVANATVVGVVDRVLHPTVQSFLGAADYSLSGSPLPDGEGPAYSGNYDWTGIQAFTIFPMPLPPA